MAEHIQNNTIYVSRGRSFNDESEDDFLVQKSNPLYSLWQSETTLAEFKILDIYLSRIDSHKPEVRAVVFDKSDLEEILGVTKLNASELEPRLIHLMGNVVKVQDKTAEKGFELVTLFESAKCVKDECGISQISLKCTETAMKYFFNIENFGYFKYGIHNVAGLKSRYSYIMFMYLEHHRNLGLSWDVSVKTLKAILKAENKSYQNFSEFDRCILKRCKEELDEKTSCHFTYEKIRRGHSVAALHITLAPLPTKHLPSAE